jgi:hypothetical protein
MIVPECVLKIIEHNFQKTGMKRPKGLIIHISEAPHLASIYNWFNNPNQIIMTSKGPKSVKASAHFGIGLDGTIWQFVDTNYMAYAQMGGNADYLSVEHVGYAGNELTEPQINALAWLFGFLQDVYGFSAALANQPGKEGLGYHSMGAAWGHQHCPGPKIIAQRSDIIWRSQYGMSVPFSQFSEYVEAKSWEKAVDALNSLAMFERLGAIGRLKPAERAEVLNQANAILSVQRGWQGSSERIRFAAEVVNTEAMPNWTPAGLPTDQVADAQRFLALGLFKKNP